MAGALGGGDWAALGDGVGTGARASGAGGAACTGGGLVDASNCCGVRMSTDTRSSSSRFGGFGNGIKASVAASSV
ncbi:hypothetical protein EB232_22750 [Mesorhizobium sp. NZP2077]|nr:hypothetical protein EB232_22750 [Mesorhizobium sp. NZP2077]